MLLVLFVLGFAVLAGLIGMGHTVNKGMRSQAGQSIIGAVFKSLLQ